MIQHASTLQDTIPTRETVALVRVESSLLYQEYILVIEQNILRSFTSPPKDESKSLDQTCKKKTRLQKALEIHSEFFTLYAWTTNNFLCRTTYVPLATVELSLIRSGERTFYPNKSQLIIISYCYILFFLFLMHFSF